MAAAFATNIKFTVESETNLFVFQQRDDRCRQDSTSSTRASTPESY